MTTIDEAGRWRAVHIFHADEPADHIVLDISDVMAAATVDLSDAQTDWFFIRYSEGGQHVRLRLGPLLSIRFDRIVDTLAQRLDARVVTERDEPGVQAIANRMVEAPYEPEIDRYGGPVALHESEALFRMSSSLSVAALAATRNDQTRRAQIAVDMMLGAAAALGDRTAAAAFLAEYGRFWRGRLGRSPATVSMAGTRAHAADRLAAIARGEAGKTPASLWHAALCRGRARLKALASNGLLHAAPHPRLTGNAEDVDRTIASIFISQVHMTNNRLGFSPLQELRWAETLAFALR